MAGTGYLEGREEDDDLHTGHEACLEVHYLDISSTPHRYSTRRGQNDIVYVEHVGTSIALHMYTQDLRK